MKVLIITLYVSIIELTKFKYVLNFECDSIILTFILLEHYQFNIIIIQICYFLSSKICIISEQHRLLNFLLVKR